MSEFSKELLSLVEISRERSIRKAADKLNIASSALSRQMRILERDLGVQLLIRNVQGVRLTEQGRVVLEQAEKWQDDSNRLRARLIGLEENNESIVRVGAMECFATSLIPELFDFAQSQPPFDRMTLKIGGTEMLVESLGENQLDLVLAFNAIHSQSVRVMSETPCRVGLVFSPDQYSIDAKEISLADCLGWPICLPGEGLSLYTRLYAEILKQRIKPNIVSTSNSVEFIRKLVIRKKAVSFLTWLDVRNDVLAGRLEFIPLAEKRLTETLCVCVSGGLPLPPKVKRFASSAEQLISAQL